MSWKSHARVMSKSDLCWGNQWMFLGTWEWLKAGSSNGRDGSSNKGSNKGTFWPARPTMKLIASPWKSMVGEWKSAFFRGELAVRFREFFNDLFSGSISLLSISLKIPLRLVAFAVQGNLWTFLWCLIPCNLKKTIDFYLICSKYQKKSEPYQQLGSRVIGSSVAR